MPEKSVPDLLLIAETNILKYYVMYFYLKQTIMTIISVLLVQLCLTVSLEIHKTACLIYLFSGHSYHVETCHLICSTYFLTGFFAVVMFTDGVFRTDYTSGVHIFVGDYDCNEDYHSSIHILSVWHFLN